MAYNIKFLDGIALQKKSYFFDANLWIKILRPPFSLSNKEQKYLAFVEKFKNNINRPKIAVTALLLSEVINRILREVHFSQYCKKNGIDKPDKSYYKSIYRISQQFQQDYILLCEDIKAYKNYYELFSDGFGVDIKQKRILTSPSIGLDFNDNYYYQMALQYSFTIVTDDSDFFVEDVEVLTYNSQLMEKMKATIKPQ